MKQSNVNHCDHSYHDREDMHGKQSARHHHCGFEKRHHLAEAKKSGKRLGAVGIALVVLHLLYHVAEILILPTIFVAWGGHHAAHHSEPVAAVSDEEPEPHSARNHSEGETSSRLFSTRLYTDFFETLY